MRKNEFKEEIHSYIDNQYDSFIKNREVLYCIFKEFHRICTKFNIKYTLAFGSLLGVIRDDDIMPPWDRDIDVVVPYNEINKLINSLKIDLNDEFYFVSNFTNKKFPYYQILLGKKGQNIHLFHVDIFYLFDVSNSEKHQELTKNKIKKLFWRRTYKYEPISFEENKFKYYGKKIRKFIFSFNFSFILNLIFKNVSKSLTTSNYYITMGSGAEIFPKELFNELKLIDVNGIEAFIIKDYDKFLTIRYGDYMTYLPIKNRFLEFYNSINLYIK